MDKETKTMLNSILEEIARLEERLEKKMDKRFDAVDRRFERIESELEQLHHEVNACKLEKGTIELLFQKIDEHEERIEQLEVKSAQHRKACKSGFTVVPRQDM